MVLRASDLAGMGYVAYLQTQPRKLMPTDAHQTKPESGPLADHKPSDMPAARTMIYVIVGLLVVFAIVAAVMDRYGSDKTPVEPADTEVGPITQ